MTSTAATVEEYLNSLPQDRQQAVNTLRKEVMRNLPKGFKEEMSYGMIGYIVPLTLYPAGYHCDPLKPLPFANIASQKNFISFYHMGLYSDENLYNWFITEYEKQMPGKPDMGKSCLRFKKPEQIPFNLIGELMSRMTPQQWIELYETKYKNSTKSK